MLAERPDTSRLEYVVIRQAAKPLRWKQVSNGGKKSRAFAKLLSPGTGLLYVDIPITEARDKANLNKGWKRYYT